MKQKTYKSYYRNLTGLVLENEFLKLVVLPSGGRVVSLFDKQKNREFLMQQEGKDYLFGIYDGDYVASKPAGFDRIDASKLYDAGSILKANSTFDWYLAFSVNY